MLDTDEFLVYDSDEDDEIEYYNNIRKREVIDSYYMYICNHCGFLMLSQRKFCPVCQSREINKEPKHFIEM